MSVGSLMPIGKFARSCRLSVKALRHYDELGLLAPTFVDPKTGYRYYERGQAREAVMIGMLRSLDLPLAAIREALQADEASLGTIVAAETARIEAEIAGRQAALLSLRHIAARGSLVDTEIELVREPPRRLACLAVTTSWERLVPDTTGLIDTLVAEVGIAAEDMPGVIGAINAFNGDGSTIGVEAILEVGAGAAPALTTASVRDADGFTAARCVHVGPYETLGLAHHALHAWIQERGHEEEGPIWEFYVNDPAATPQEGLETVVLLPIRSGD